MSRGMEFGALDGWWGQKQRRSRPHEGIDIVRFRESSAGECKTLRDVPLRAIEGGQCVAIMDDFLGKTLVVRRFRSLGGKQQFFVYGHLQLASSMRVGREFGPGSVIGCVRESVKSCPEHLHISLVEVERDVQVPWAEMTWDSMHSLGFCVFLPLTI